MCGILGHFVALRVESGEYCVGVEGMEGVRINLTLPDILRHVE